jgi:hypothetical protein
MSSMSLLSRQIVRRPFLCRRLVPVWTQTQLRRNTTAAPTTIAESITKPVSEAPESIQEETIKGIRV